jgi:hypothetical protein
MASIVVNGDTSGAVTLSAPATAGTVTVTLPATSGTMLTTASSTGVSGSAISSGTVAEAYGGTGTNTGYYGFKNRIINGAMVINQRAFSATITTNQYTLDRWQAISPTDSGKFSVSQSATTATGFSYSLLATSLTAYTVLTNDRFSLAQAIEGYNTADLGWGTANAQTVTLSFWVRSSLTGTFGGALQNSNGDRSYPFTFTISSANTFEYKTITVAGPTSGTWFTTNGVGMYVYFGLGVGATYSGTAGAWANADYRSATGATSLVSTNGATMYITGVQLEKGSTATSFDYRPYTTELQLCQRYFVSLQEGIWTANGSGTATAGLYLPVTMRATPTLYATPTAITIWDPQIGSYAQSSANGSLPIGGPSKDFVIIQCGNFSGMTTGRMLFWQSGGSIQLGAEL